MMKFEDSFALWMRLDELEAEAGQRLSAELSPLEPALSILHAAGHALTELPGGDPDGPHLDVAFGALLRCMDDLRSMWLLLNKGYTAAAAAVAADLWEHAMIASAACVDPELAEQFKRDTPGDRSFGAFRLAEKVGEAWVAHKKDHPQHALLVKIETLELHLPYKALCQVKHPTLRALAHTTGASTSTEGASPVGAHPDWRPEDLPLKKVLVAQTFLVLERTLTHFGTALGVDAGSPECQEWLSQLEAAKEILKKYIPTDTMKLPFNVWDTDEAKELRELRKQLAEASS